MARQKKSQPLAQDVAYDALLSGISNLLEAARRMAARRVQSVITATYWEIGRRLIEHEQGGERRAEYGEQVVTRLAADLTRRHGRGFSKSNVFLMRGLFPGLGDFPDTDWKIGRQGTIRAGKGCSGKHRAAGRTADRSGHSDTEPQRFRRCLPALLVALCAAVVG
jgi:hypothetical protein